MTSTPAMPPSKRPKPDSREARLKAALKANMARRKTQARARADGEDEAGPPAAEHNDNRLDEGKE